MHAGKSSKKHSYAIWQIKQEALNDEVVEIIENQSEDVESKGSVENVAEDAKATDESEEEEFINTSDDQSIYESPKKRKRKMVIDA